MPILHWFAANIVISSEDTFSYISFNTGLIWTKLGRRMISEHV